MAMTVAEASNLNVVLRWAMGQPRWTGGPAITDETATEAARALAARSLKAIGAGLRPEEVTLTRQDSAAGTAPTGCNLDHLADVREALAAAKRTQPPGLHAADLDALMVLMARVEEFIDHLDAAGLSAVRAAGRIASGWASEEGTFHEDACTVTLAYLAEHGQPVDYPAEHGPWSAEKTAADAWETYRELHGEDEPRDGGCE
jgi:hypothetical protein